MKKFYENPLSSFFILSAITLLLAFSATKVKLGFESANHYCIYTIEFNYHGLDSKKIESLITQPFEEKLSELTDVIEIRSSCEYGKSMTSIYFDRKSDNESHYLHIRNIVENFYNELPSDVQKPVIYNSNAQTKSLMNICVYQKEENTNLSEIRSQLEAKIKKSLEGIEGLSQVVISGGGQKEIQLLFDSEKSASSMINPQQLACVVQDANSVMKSAKIYGNRKNIDLDFDIRLKNLDEIASLPVRIGESSTELKFLADLRETNRFPDEIVRVNGKECVLISIKSNSDGNAINICRSVRKILDENSSLFEFNVLYDEGKVQLKLLKSVLFAFLQSFVLVILLLPFFFNSVNKIFLSIIFMILNTVWSVGLLRIAGLNLTQHTIAGFSISLGLIADPLLVIFEAGKNHVAENVKSIVTASCTTLIVLVPLLFLDKMVPGVKDLAITVGLMIIVSLILSIVFFPSFMENGTIDKQLIPGNISQKFEKFYIRFSYYFSDLSIKKNGIFTIIYFLLLSFAPIIFVFSGKNLNFENIKDIVYCSAEFENEVSPQYISDRVNLISEKLKKIEGVRYVICNSTKGSSEIEVAFDPKIISRKRISNTLESMKSEIPESFLYVADSNMKVAKKHLQLEIAIIGDDDEKCREFAKLCGKKLLENPGCENLVLNFKRQDKEFVFIPDLVKLGKNGLSVEQVSSILRWFMFGPVADKWIKNGIESDIRIAGKNLERCSLQDLENLKIPTKTGSVNLTGLGKIVESQANGKIYRKNGRHAAYITLEVNGLSSSRAMKMVKDELENIDFDKGYGYSFSHELEEMGCKYLKLAVSFIISFILILLLICALTEDLKKSILLVSSIGVTLFFPLISNLIFDGALEMGDVIALVILSGICINNAIYVLEGKSENVKFKLREKIKSILVTSLTTILTSIPLLIFAQDAFSKSLSFFMLTGILSSLFVILILFPGLLEKIKKINEKEGCR